jgi:hypothetical protein
MAISMSVKVTVPELVLDSALVRHMIERTLERKTGPDLSKEFRKTVQGWSSPPRFNPHIHNFSGHLSAEVSTDAERYIFVNNGTSAHVISPKNARGLLRFQPGYRAATRPGSISSSRPSRFGDHISSRKVFHPGVEPRNFDQIIAESYEDTFVSDIQDAIRMAVQKA